MKKYNVQNLIPNSERTPSELRDMGRKGGIASGEKRRYYRGIKKALEFGLKNIDKMPESELNKEMAIIKLWYSLSDEEKRNTDFADIETINELMTKYNIIR